MKIKENIKTFLNKVCKSTKVVNKTREGGIQKENGKMEEIKEKEKVEQEQPIEKKEDDKAVVDGKDIDLKDKKVEVEIEQEDKKGEDASQCPECDEKEQEQEQTTAPNKVMDTEPSGNGIKIEDLVTKDMLSDRLSAMESKMEALINENKGLTEKLAQMSEKYEEKDFGGFTKQGIQDKDKVANSTFDDYCKQFM